MTKQRPINNGHVFLWAREQAGLSLEDASKMIGISSSRLTDIEQGQNGPTRSQLAKIAKTYHRPLVLFFLSATPRIANRGKDFRKLPGEPDLAFDAGLDALIRDVTVRQAIVASALADLEAPKVAFVGASASQPSIADMAIHIGRITHFSLDRFRSSQNPEKAFAYLRGCIEAAGAYVVLVGDLGSHHTAIPADVFRGYAIADKQAPFIVINNQDAKVAWSFTALHELVHVCLGDSGISGGNSANTLEAYCNDVASAILLPDIDKLVGSFVDANAAIDRIGAFAQERNISRAMVAYRLFRGGRIGQKTWDQLRTRFSEEWLTRKEAARLEPKGDKKISYYNVRKSRVGPSLINLMRRSLAERVVTYSKAGLVLGVKTANVEMLLR